MGVARHERVASAGTAYRWLLASVVLSLLAFGVGAAWHRAWHARNTP